MASLASKYAAFDKLQTDLVEEEAREEKQRNDVAKAESARKRQEYQEARMKAMADYEAKEAAKKQGGALPDPKATAGVAAASGAAQGQPPSPGTPGAGPMTMMESGASLDPSEMTEAQRNQFVDQYAKMMNRNRGANKAAYKFPDTIEEQREICKVADELRTRGNALYKKGELTEAAKLYEQAVLKFADWYADCFATEEEKELALSVKLPSHLNLAACSWKLGNYQHAVTHCSQVLQHEARNSGATNAKAFYRRGSCHLQLGNLDEARADLRKAASLAPADAEIRRALRGLQGRQSEYGATQKAMARSMLAGAGGDAAAEDASATAAGAAGDGGEKEGVAADTTAPAAAELPIAEQVERIKQSLVREVRKEVAAIRSDRAPASGGAPASDSAADAATVRDDGPAAGAASPPSPPVPTGGSPASRRMYGALAILFSAAAVACVAVYLAGY